MKFAKKQHLALQRRIEGWEAIKEQGFKGPRTKIARGEPLGNGMAYHMPGSQNRKKGYQRSRSTKY